MFLLRLPENLENKTDASSDEASIETEITAAFKKSLLFGIISDISKTGKNITANVKSPLTIKESLQSFADITAPTATPTNAQAQTVGITSEFGSSAASNNKGIKSESANVIRSAAPPPISEHIKTLRSFTASGLLLFFFIYIPSSRLIYMSFRFDLFRKQLICEIKGIFVQQTEVHCGNIYLFNFIVNRFGVIKLGPCFCRKLVNKLFKRAQSGSHA